MDFDRYDHIRPIRWQAGSLQLLDQRKLPFTVEYVDCRTSQEVDEAIRSLVVRGAPAIGIAAAFGVVLAANGIQARDRRAGAGADAAGYRRAQPVTAHRGEPDVGHRPHASGAGSRGQQTGGR